MKGTFFKIKLQRHGSKDPMSKSPNKEKKEYFFSGIGILLLLLTTLTLSGCFAGRKVEKEGGNVTTTRQRGSGQKFDWDKYLKEESSDFFIDKTFKGEGRLDEKAIDEQTGLYSYVEYTFTITLRSRGNEQILTGQNFLIKGTKGEEIHKIKIKRNGTATWTEKIEFDQQRPQLNPVLVIREVIGLGAARGKAFAIYEINPWALTESEIKSDFRNLTDDLEQLQARHPYYDPEFNYLEFLSSPSGIAAINVKAAKFYIAENTDEKIIFDTVAPAGVNLYNRNRPLEEKEDINALKGNLYKYSVPDYVTKRMDEEGILETDTGPVGMSLTLSANIYLERKYFIGDQVKYADIEQGKFMVFAAVLGTNQGRGKGPVILAYNTNPQIGEVNNRMLNVKFKMLTPYLVNRGDIDIALKVWPMERYAELGVQPFGVIYKVGAYTNFGRGFPGDFQNPINAEEGFNFDDYITSAKHYTDEYKNLLLSEGYLREARDIIFSAMDIKFRTVKAGETASQRTVIFSVTTCPYDGLTGAALDEGRRFKVLVSGTDPLSKKEFSRRPLNEIRPDGGPNVVAVENGACLSWIDEIAHKYYQREDLIEREYHLISTEGKEYSLKGFFNPWDEKYGTLGVDARTLSDKFIEEIKKRKKLPSRFFVGDFSYMTLRFRYNVDKDMKLTVKKTVLMTLYPFIKRYSNIINGINGNFPIRDGVYLLKLGYQKDYIDPGAPGIKLTPDEENSRVKINITYGGNEGVDQDNRPFLEDDLRRKTMIHTTKKLIRVENNRVITPIEFEIDELRTLRVRSNLLVQLEPVNQYKLQIVNLFEEKIAEKLTVEIGNANRLHCLPPDYKDLILDAFQETLDNIAKAIPDDKNYNSKEAFKEVIFSPEVVEALKPLTENGRLQGIENILSLNITEEEVQKAFQELGAGELKEIYSLDKLNDALASIDRERALDELEEEAKSKLEEEAKKDQQRVREENKKTFRVFENIAKYVDLSAKDDADLQVPIGEDQDLNEEAREEAPRNVLGSDESVLSDVIRGLRKYRENPNLDKDTERFLDELSVEENVQNLISNDFTIDPAVARVSDLDLLIDRKAGIQRRTFVGPLTLIALDNKNTMIATDALDYNICINENDDCSNTSVKDSVKDRQDNDYVKNTNFGFQGQFKNCHVDDFIIKEDQEDILYSAWKECIIKDLIPANEEFNGEFDKITFPKITFLEEEEEKENYICDYTKTETYKKYPHVFAKYKRYGDELKAKGGLCPYRERWLKKYFFQRQTKRLQKQFANFLSNPEIQAKNLVPIDKERALEVTEIDPECLKNNFINEECAVKTDKYDLPVKEIAKNLLEYGAPPQTPYKFLSSELKLQDTIYKETLTDFYTTFNNKSKQNLEEYSNALYDTLIKIAAPAQNRESYKGRLEQVAPADFGPDVQKLFCNILIPYIYIPLLKDKAMGRLNDKNTDEPPKNINPFEVEPFHSQLLMSCFNYAEAESVEVPRPFNIERKFRTLETGRYFFRGGKSINFNIGQSVGVGHNLSFSNGVTIDPYNGILKGVGEAAGGLLSKPVVKAVFGSFKLVDYSKSESNSYSDGLTLGENTNLSMQAAQLDLELKKYRRCILVRWNDEYLSKALRVRSKGLIDKIKETNLFICNEVENRPVAVRENYYYVTQIFNEGDLLDSGSLLNNPWLLELRGYRDMVAFVTSMYPEGKFDASIMNLMKDDLNKVMTERDIFTPAKTRIEAERNTFEDELEAWKIMSKSYRKVTPAFPGLFTQLSYREYSLPDWPWNQESQITEEVEPTCE